MTKLNTLEQRDFTGGLHTKFDAWLCPKTCATKLQNIEVSKGGFRRIGGSAKLNTTAVSSNPIKSLYRMYAGATYRLIFTCGTDIYYWHATNGATSLKTGLTANKAWSMAMYNAYAYMVQKDHTPQKWDLIASTTSAMTGPAVNCDKIVFWNNRAWCAINDTYPDRLYYSADGNPESWGATNYIPIPMVATDERITGLIPFLGRLCIFTDNSITLLSGNDDASWQSGLQTTEWRVGCINHRTVKLLNNLVIFLGRDGIYAYDGVTAHRISDGIQNTIDDINRTYISNCCAETDEQRYYLSYTSASGGGSVNDKMIIFDTTHGLAQGGVINGAWTGPHTIGAGSLCFWQGIVDQGELYYGDATSTGFIHEFYDPAYKDFSGSSMTGILETADWGSGDPDNKIDLQECIIVAEPEGDYDVTVKYYKDNSSTATSLGTVNLASAGKRLGDRSDTSVTRTLIIHPLKFPAGTSVQYVKLKITLSGTGYTGIIREIILKYKPAVLPMR
jgi:hypothetical protein